MHLRPDNGRFRHRLERLRHVLLRGLSCCVFAAIAGCSQQQPGSCSTSVLVGRPIAIAKDAQVQESLEAIRSAAVLGGWLDIGGKRCSATLQVDGSSAQSFKVTVWTARHCGADVIQDNIMPTLHLYLFDGYAAIPLIDDIVARRGRALQAAREARLSQEAQNVLAQVFKPSVGIVRSAEDTGCYDSDQATADRKAGKQVVCANWLDVGAYEATIDRTKLSQAVAAQIEAAAARKKKTESQLSGSSDLQAIQDWSNTIRTAWQAQRMKHYADALHWANDVCTANQRTSTTLQCTNLDAFFSIAQRDLTQNGESIIDRARRLGFWDDATRTLRLVNGMSFGNRLKSEEGLLTEKISRYWRDLGVPLLASPVRMWILGNLQQSTGAAPSFASFPLSRIVDSAALAGGVYQPNGLQLSQRADEIVVSFSKGDSGTVFAAYGLYPVLALSGVNGEQTSGGVAVIPLPTASGNAQPVTSSLAADGDASVSTEDASRSATKGEPSPNGC